MLQWKPHCCHLMGKLLLLLLRFLVMRPVQMFVLLGSGVDVRVHFLNIRVFHPNAPSYLRTQPASLFRRHELKKKQEYDDRI